MTSVPASERLTASLFYDPVVYLLGVASGFKPYVGVPHEDIRDDVLRLAGVEIGDQENRARDTCSELRDGLYRRVHFAWRNQRNGYCGHRVAYCARPIDGARGQWALTHEGVRHAKQIRSKYEGKIVRSSGPNTTAQFIGRNFQQTYDRLTLHLRRKMPRSETLGKIDDHAMTWLERLIARDGLRKRLEEKRPPAPSQLCAWARRSAYSDIRNEGREPVCRLLHGALTKPEIALYDPTNWTTTVIPRSINDSDVYHGNRHSEHSEDDTATTDMTEHLADEDNFESTFANSDAFEAILGRVAGVLHDEISEPTDVDWHLSVVVDRFVREMTVREIAESRGLTYEDGRSKISKALERVRVLMSQARADGEFDDVFTT